jgi:hypothetical protein
LHAWLEAHPQFGPSLRAWREEGAVPARAKLLAVVTLLLSWGLLVWHTEAPWVPVGAGLFFTVIAVFLLTRRAPRETGRVAGRPLSCNPTTRCVAFIVARGLVDWLAPAVPFVAPPPAVASRLRDERDRRSAEPCAAGSVTPPMNTGGAVWSSTRITVIYDFRRCPRYRRTLHALA